MAKSAYNIHRGDSMDYKNDPKFKEALHTTKQIVGDATHKTEIEYEIVLYRDDEDSVWIAVCDDVHLVLEGESLDELKKRMETQIFMLLNHDGICDPLVHPVYIRGNLKDSGVMISPSHGHIRNPETLATFAECEEIIRRIRAGDRTGCMTVEEFFAEAHSWLEENDDDKV